MQETDFESFTNYKGFDTDDDAFAELWSFVEGGQLAAYPNLNACKKGVSGTPLLSRFGLITKWKNGKLKKRIILDCKQSGLSKRTRRKYRVILPRIRDAVRDVLILLSSKLPPEMVEMFILDFTNAFWTVPLDLQERKYFVGRVRGWYLVYNTTAQGSRNAPLSWCSLVALLARLTQGLFDPHREARLQVYVDDPALSVCGDVKKRNRIICTTIVIWHICGFKLAYGKGKRGQNVTWIGGDITITSFAVTVSIPDDKCKELLELS